MDFGNVRTEAGQAKLNDFMATHSYVNNFEPTQEDASLFSKLLLTPPPPKKFPHAHRWYSHIAAFSDAERQLWKGTMQAATAGPKAADADLDLFGQESEEVAAAPSRVVAAIKQQAAPVKKEKKPVIDKSQLVIDVKPVSLDTNLDELEKDIRAIKMEGLEWSQACKKLPLAFGLIKVQIACVIIDSLVSTDDLIGQIECIGLTPEQAAEKARLRDEGDDEIDEDAAAEDESDPPGKVMSAEIVSFNKL